MAGWAGDSRSSWVWKGSNIRKRSTAGKLGWLLMPPDKLILLSLNLAFILSTATSTLGWVPSPSLSRTGSLRQRMASGVVSFVSLTKNNMAGVAVL